MKSTSIALSLPVFAAALALSAAPSVAEARRVKVKHGTLAPEGTPWFNAMKRLERRWEKASDGKVQVKIYPGGVAGDEGDMIRKMKIGQLDSGTVTGIGLAQISRSTLALQLPMMFDSYEELDFVRERVGPRLEKELADAGFIVLNWGDAGWVHMFSKEAGKTPADFQQWKMFMWSGDPQSEQAWKKAGFKPVPMSATDVMSGLQTGLIEWYPTTPLYALSSQWFGLTKHMLAVNWTPLNGATIISKDSWEKIPAALRPELKKIAREEGDAVRKEVRALGDKAIKAMKDRGLQIVEADAALTSQWKAAAVKAYPYLREDVVPGDLFDEVQRLVAEYRKKSGK